MNEKNFEYLKDQIKFTGFGEGMENALKEKIEKGETEFTLNHNVKYGNDTVSAILNFKKSDQSEMYFFNSFKITLEKEQSKEALSQTFYINKDNNITAKEAYNLMEGRSVNKDLKNKDGELYNAWIKMNFKEEADDKGNFKLNHYHQNYGYDLEASLGKHPIKELENEKYKGDLLNSLKKGNVQSVTFVIDGIDKKQYVEANPHFKTVNVYDAGLQRINNRESKDQKKSESEKESNSKGEKQKNDIDSEPSQAGEKTKTKRKKQSNSI
ncbi:hypothetical protein [Flavobacterium granuli]|uniref:Leucyl aminopeptidase n=1 Tax=Flavobacterium granuli TaxID=280093 RepID=A0ABU1S3E7_9FLAO|nr:hypothetical protein [Flavobacterium granuli]MDR6845564.1 leucyl aminopeptidase [Flavobacterium granuli]